MWDGRYWWTATTSIARKKGGSLPLQTHLLLSHLICYIHWLPRTITTFRENRSSTLERATTTGSEARESRALSSRRKNRVYTARAVVPNDRFLLSMSLLFFLNIFFTFYDRHEFRPFLDNAPVPNRGKSRRASESTLKTHRMSRRSLNKINMAAINV